jgi:ABC-type sugar transport system ATPase subunit
VTRIELRGVTGAPRGGRPIVADLSLAATSGEVLALLGPSGSGKTTVLRIVAGLEDVTGGDVLVGGARVNDQPTHSRDLAMVTEEQTMLAYLDVEGNIGFGLRVRGVKGAEVDERVRTEARAYGLAGLLRRRPRSLSAGQRQAASVARATVRLPRAFLLDEPFSRIDARERLRLRNELGRYVRALGVTTLLATNDQGEALAVADRIAVLRGGRLEQVDTPERLYHRPANAFVAAFVGDPGMNILRVLLEAGSRTTRMRAGGHTVTLPALPERLRQAYDGSPVLLGVRPEHLRVTEPGTPGTLPAVVERAEYLGATTRLRVRLDETDAVLTVVRASAEGVAATGQRIAVQPRPAGAHLFDPASEEAVWPSL